MPRCSPLPSKCIIFLRPSDQEQWNVGVGAVSGGLYLLPADLEFETTSGWGDSNYGICQDRNPFELRREFLPDLAKRKVKDVFSVSCALAALQLRQGFWQVVSSGRAKLSSGLKCLTRAGRRTRTAEQAKKIIRAVASFRSITFKLLTEEQRRAIYTALKGQPAGPAFNADIGAELPSSVELRPMPDDVVARVQQTKDYRYAVADNRVLLVSPVTRYVVGIFVDDVQAPKAGEGRRTP